MRVHFDVLGWLHISAGAFGLLTGLSLGVLAMGTAAALSDRSAQTSSPAAWFLLACGGAFLVIGALTILVGRALVTRQPAGRTAALALAIPSLLVIPFGTALAVYSFWALLNADARHAFSRRADRIDK
jgi:threonine/homoserine efflux transporter RhtA